MSRYLVRFTPMEPYFFGNERTLSYPDSTSQYQNLYFVRGENTPLQTTLLGALRFMLLQKHGRKPDNFRKLKGEKEVEEDKQKGISSVNEENLIGKNSFNPEIKQGQGFGVIKKLSPVFLTDAIGIHYIPAPMDHNLADEEKNTDDHTEYAPFRQYHAIETADGKKLFTAEYDVKKGTASGFMSLADGSIHEDLFSGSLRVGINRREQENGFFKKEYKRLKTGFSFAVYCDLDEAWENMPETVFLGQGHSTFRVQAESADEHPGIEKETLDFFRQHPLFTQNGAYTLLYCLGDSFMTSEDTDGRTGLYDGLLFSVTDTRDFRSMQTKSEDGGRLTRSKQSMLYHLMKAGSVLIAENDEAARAWLNRYKHPNAETIGFNTFVGIESEEETK